jgi:hypothetical protein
MISKEKAIFTVDSLVVLLLFADILGLDTHDVVGKGFVADALHLAIDADLIGLDRPYLGQLQDHVQDQMNFGALTTVLVHQVD